MAFAPNQWRNNKWARRAAWCAGAVLILWALAWLAVPPLLKHQGEKLASEALGRRVEIGGVDFRPWSLELALHDVSVASAEGAAAQLRIKRLYMNAALQSLVRLAPVADAIAVEQPQFVLTHRGDGHYDIDDVLQRLASRPPPHKPSDPPRFALYNLRLTEGSIDFTDQPHGRTHTVRDLRLEVPFLSNLSSHRDIKTEPRLAFVLNGGHFDSQAAATPFAQTGKADAALRVADLDLAPYLRYLPPGLPVQPQAALLDADVRLAFEQGPKPALKLSGSVQLRQARVADAAGRELLALDGLQLDLADVRPLEQSAHFSSLTLAGPRVLLARDRVGRLNVAPGPHAQGSSGPVVDKKGAAPTAWKITLDQFALRDGQLGWADASTEPAARITVREIALQASALTFPTTQEAQFKGELTLADAPPVPARGAKAEPPAALRFEGRGSAASAGAQLNVANLPLTIGGPYLSQWLVPAVSGSLQADVQVQWKAPTEAAPGGETTVQIAQLSVGKPALAHGGTTWAALDRLQLQDGRIDLARQTVALGKLSVQQPRLRLERARDGQWMFARWRKDGPPAEVAPTASASASKAGPSKPWSVVLQETVVEGGALSFQDLAKARPVALELTGLRLRAQNLAPEGNQPAALQLAARIGAGRTEPGTLQWRGSVHPGTLAAQGEVEAQHLPLHALEPYFGDALNVELLRADTSFKGRLDYAALATGPRLRVRGDVAVEELRANTRSEAAAGLGGSDELLSWKALHLRGLDLALAPGAATTVDVQETVLSDFYARLIVQENGRINLQDLVRHAGQPAATTTAVATVAAASAASAPVAAAAPSPTDPVMRFGPMSLINGKVYFSDRFVKPNYSANLSELTGKLSAFSSVPVQGAPQLADLELRGRAEGTASLEITGKLNPLAQPLALDIQGKVRDLELPPLSPYSVKYAGHGIERGKLSVDVAYVVQPNGQLTASNKLVLTQLVFGDKVEGAPASLPVKLAVALLADRNGVIDINLPVSGSLNDPQFSLGPVIFKLIANLVVKAIASPFTLLASAFGGGGDELSMVGFPAGSAQLGPEAKAGLDKVAKALADRPALRMTVVGTASLEAEREAYRRDRLMALLLVEKRRGALRSGVTPATTTVAGSGTAVASAAEPVDNAAESTSVSPAEYTALLKEVYRRADIPKPRNLVGMAKDLPTPEMEALLLAQIPVTEERMRELALARGVAVRDYLAMRQLAPERLFLGAAKAVVPESKWSPRAELQLATP